MQIRPGARAAALFVLACAAATLPAAAQSRGVVELPKLDETAQGLALGDSAAALTGLNALGANPGALYSQRAELLSQYRQLPLRTSLTKLAAGYPLRAVDSSLAVSYLNLRSAAFDGRDEQGAQTGQFSTQDQLIGLHASRRLSEDLPVSAGVSVKFLRMSIADASADAVAFDAGARYAFSALPLTLGAAALNLGRGPRFADQASPLPLTYALSASYRLPGGLEIAANFAERAAERRQDFNIGMQYAIGSVLALRGRYGMAQAGTQGAGSSFAAGIGFKLFGAHALDYAFQPFDSSLQQSAGAGTHMVTLTMRFGASQEMPARRTRGSDWSIGAEPSTEQQAAVALGEGRFAVAVSRLRQAGDAEPRRRDLRERLTRARRFSDAIPEALGEESASALVRRAARAYVADADASAAVQSLRQAFNEQPGDERLLPLLNALETEAGVELTQRGFDGSRTSLLDMKIAAARRALLDSHPDVAMKRAREALSLEHDNLTALQLLGSAYYVAGDRASALKVWRRVREIEPGNEAVARFLDGGSR